jgi:hypothetical protein
MISTVTTTSTTTTATSTTTAAATTAATTAVTPDMVSLGVIAVVALIILLALKEILSSEADKNTKIKKFLSSTNVGIVPLLLVFVAIVAFKVVEIL